MPLSPDLIARARGTSVLEVAVRYGYVPNDNGSQAGTPCPGCGGRDRFGLKASKNVWSCRQGGGTPIGGDAIALVQHVENCSFIRAVEIITGISDASAPKKFDAVKAEKDAEFFRERERKRAFQIWKAARPAPENGIAASYFAKRAIPFHVAQQPGSHCREADVLPFWHHCFAGTDTKQWRVIYEGPAVIWPITDSRGHFFGVHCTWVDIDQPNGKAEIFDPDTGEQLRAQKNRGSKKGGRIVLCEVPGVSHAATGEGLETTLSWAVLCDVVGVVNLYAAVDLGNLAGKSVRTVPHPTKKQSRRDNLVIPMRVQGPDPDPSEDPARLFSVPENTSHLTLLGDGDSDPFATHCAMIRAKKRFLSFRPDMEVELDFALDGKDFNDVLRERYA